MCAYGQILPSSVLAICPWLNLHPSLLPRWRGAAPIERALLAGDEATGVAVMQTVAALDAGPVVDQVGLPIAPDADAHDVARSALEAGVPLLLSALASAAAGTLRSVEQSEEGVSYAEKLTRADRLLDPMSSTVQGAHDRVRALRPHIGALIDLEDQTVTIWRATPSTVQVPAGAVEADESHLRIGFTDGALDVLEVQTPGRRALPTEEWLRGARAVPTRARRPT